MMSTPTTFPSLRGHIFLGDGAGKFEDATNSLWQDSVNAAADDNMVVVLDYDSDGDSDFLIGSLSGSDRLLINDGAGKLAENASVFPGPQNATPGTLCIQVADLNGDAKLDVVQCQGEAATPDKVYIGTGIAPDTAPPVVARVEAITEASINSDVVIRARVHDNKSPTMPHDWTSVLLRVDGADTPMIWYGEYLWRGSILSPTPGSTVEYQVCAEDAAGNSVCSELQSLNVEDRELDAGILMGGDAGGENSNNDTGGCGCQSTGQRGTGWLLLPFAILLWRRRKLDC